MDSIATYKRTRKIIADNDFLIKKGYGQNFLIDPHVISKIAAGAGITPNDLVIEIGPGLGALTEKLAPACKKLIAVEIDSKLIPILTENLKEQTNITIINEDILKINISEIIESAGFKSAKIAANLPYYITTPIIMGVLESKAPVESMTVMVQKEVAQRIKAQPGSKDYGALTAAVSYYADTKVIAGVPVNCFIPRPKVDSAVIRLDLLKSRRVNPYSEEDLFSLIKASFSMRRKTLVNCLFARPENKHSKAELEHLLKSMGFSPSVRGESLNLSDFTAISNALVLSLPNFKNNF